MDASPSLGWLRSALASVEGLPLGAHAVPILLLVCGALFWLVGGRFLKVLFSLIGLAVGIALGAVLAPQVLPDQVGSVPGSYVGMGIGGLLGLIASVVAFRFSMAFCGAVTLAAVGALGVGVYLSRQPDALPMQQAGEARERLAPSAESLGQTLGDAAREYQEKIKTGAPAHTDPAEPAVPSSTTAAALDATRQFADAVHAEADELWNTTPERSRMYLILAAAAGALIGTAAGLTMPKRAASIVTAVAGAGVTLASAGWLARAAELPGAGLLSDRGPLGLLTIWGAMALFGAVVQLRAEKRRPPPEKKPDQPAQAA